MKQLKVGLDKIDLVQTQNEMKVDLNIAKFFQLRLIHDQNANRPLLKIGVDDIMLSFNMNSVTRTEKTNMSVALQCAPSVDLFVLNQYDY